MSEYQYYEFRAIDRPLTKEEMAQVRQTSTRAEITPTSFVNVYNWGDYHGDPLELMARYYDAHVYTANWGTHNLMFGFPRRLLDPAVANPFCVTDAMRLHDRGDRVVLEFLLSPDDGGGYWDEGDGDWLGRLVALRADLAQGDLRALYLGWLLGVQEDFGFGYVAESGEDAGYADEDDEADYYVDEAGFPEGQIAGSAVEPAVPPGLRQLTEPLQALVEFLSIDQDLLAVAAERSADFAEARPSADDLNRWLATLPVAAKDALILRLLAGEGAGLRLELLRRYQEATGPKTVAPQPGRKVGELLAAAREHAIERRRREAEQAAREKARKERAAAAARAAYLDGLAGQEERLWRQAETLIDAKLPQKYDQAVQLLVDLHDFTVRREQSLSGFQARVNDLRTRHSTKRSFLSKLTQAGL
ncbi:MAG TPA: hypothetical protein VH482_16600 [Thermomicrobiales bacterium]